MFGIKRFFKVSMAGIFCLLLAVGVKTMNVVKLSSIEGERTYFLDSASSQGLIKKQLGFADLWRVKGECVSFEIDANEGTMFALSTKILREYKAEMQCVERASNVTSLYAYSPLLGENVFVGGKAVNLHIALSSTRCTVGTPIIFGGF